MEREQAHRVRFKKPSAIEALFVTFKEIALLFRGICLSLKHLLDTVVYFINIKMDPVWRMHSPCLT